MLIYQDLTSYTVCLEHLRLTAILQPMQSRQIRGLALILALVAAFLVYTFAQYRSNQKRLEESRRVQAEERNIYIITASGLRPDHLSIFQYEHTQTPAIDFLANDGVRFTNAFSTSPESLAAHLSLLSGIYPFRRPVRETLDYWYENRTSDPPAVLITLSKTFQKKGYLTGAFLSDPDLRYPSLFNTIFQQVFCGDREVRRWQSGYELGEASRLARDWVIRHKLQKQFLLLNFNEPTLPFEPPPPFDKQYPKHPYDGEIAALDVQIGLFVNTLKSVGLFERSIIVLTSPYTESLEGSTHSGSLEDVTLKVPLFIAAPGLLPRQQRYDSQVSQVDVAPTILALQGWTADQNFDGFPIFKRDSRQELTREFIFAESRLPSLFGFNPKYLIRSPASRLVVRNPESDSENMTPGEIRMTKIIGEELKKDGVQQPGSLQPASAFDPGSLMEKVRTMAIEKHPGLAFDLLDSLRDNFNPSPALFRIMGDLSLEAGLGDTSLSLYRQSYEASKNPEILPLLTRAYAVNGRWEEARPALQEYQKRSHNISYYDYSMIGLLQFHFGKYPDALQNLNKAITLNSRYAEAYLYRANLYQAMGQAKEAAADFRRVIQIDPAQTLAYRSLVRLLMKTTQKKEALPYLKQLMERNPHDYETVLQLAELQGQLGNRSEVIRLCQLVLLNAKDEKLEERAKAMIAH
jgi:Tfp pilus assembly protein PilF